MGPIWNDAGTTGHWLSAHLEKAGETCEIECALDLHRPLSRDYSDECEASGESDSLKEPHEKQWIEAQVSHPGNQSGSTCREESDESDHCTGSLLLEKHIILNREVFSTRFFTVHDCFDNLLLDFESNSNDEFGEIETPTSYKEQSWTNLSD